MSLDRVAGCHQAREKELDIIGDPALQVDVYDGTASFLRELQLDQDALTKAIIGTIGDIDAYQLPDAKGHSAFMRHLLKVTDADRQQRREQILSTSLKDFRSASNLPDPFEARPLPTTCRLPSSFSPLLPGDTYLALIKEGIQLDGVLIMSMSASMKCTTPLVIA